MKKLFALPMIWLILGAVAIATEIKTTDLLPARQQLSTVVTTCLKNAVEKKETTFVSASTIYRNGYLSALTTRKTAIIAARSASNKKDIKTALWKASKTYKTTLTTLKKALKDSQKANKVAYKSETKACKSTGLQDLIETPDIED